MEKQLNKRKFQYEYVQCSMQSSADSIVLTTIDTRSD